jgi:hypothetical protein
MLHLKTTVEDDKTSAFVEMQASVVMKLRPAGRMWSV